MIEVASFVGAASAVLLVLALGAWLMLLRGPELYRARGPARSRPIERASQLVVVAFGVAAVAAILAVTGFILG
jgi:hypothetical protein